MTPIEQSSMSMGRSKEGREDEIGVWRERERKREAAMDERKGVGLYYDGTAAAARSVSVCPSTPTGLNCPCPPPHCFCFFSSSVDISSVLRPVYLSTE
jgi:hypothetical protein